MNFEQAQDEPIELGVASAAIKGGPMGYEDEEGTLWVRGGLSHD